jgi:aldehyde:ferredoxin oxidoreductase
MADLYGWVGKILRVDLTAGKTTEVPTSNYVPKFIGGRSVGAKILWDEVPANVGALSPENRIVFMTGPATGTLIPGGARVECMFKAPATHPVEGYAWSGAGGFFGPELKAAGYDGIIIQGKAKELSYLWINDGQAEIIPAPMLTGMTTFDTQKDLKDKHGEKTRCVTIGPAGENLCRSACIIAESASGFGEGGGGAVMGSKNLKAIAVRGTGSVKVPDVKQHMALCQYLYGLTTPKLTRALVKAPTYGVGGATGSAIYEEYQAGTAKTYGTACHGCSKTCNTTIKFANDPSLSGAGQCVETDIYVAPEVLYYGGKPSGRVAWMATIMSDALGLNAYEFRFYHSSAEMMKPPFAFPPDCSGGGSWLWECYNLGIFNEKNTELPWDKFGSKEFLLTLMNGVAYRKGKYFLYRLGEGVPRCAEYIKNNPKEFNLTQAQGDRCFEAYQRNYPRAGKFGGYPAHHCRCGCSSKEGNGRITPTGMMYWAISQRDPATGHDPNNIWNAPRGDEQRMEIGKRFFNDPKALLHDYDGEVCWSSKGKTTKQSDIQYILRDSITFCDYNRFYYSQYTKDRNGDWDAPSKIFNSVTGLNMTEVELEKAAERGRTLERAISVREGRTRADDILWDYWLYAPDRVGRIVNKVKWDAAMDEYYTAMGYDLSNGWPTRARLEDLDLKDVADEMQKLGKLG